MACEAPLRGGWTRGDKGNGQRAVKWEAAAERIRKRRGSPPQDSGEIKNPSLLYEVTDSLWEGNSPSLERKTRLELATLTLARLCSTNWAISAYRFSDYKGNTIFLLCNTFGVKLRWKSRFFLEWSRLYSCNIPVISSLLFKDVWIYFSCTKSGGTIAHIFITLQPQTIYYLCAVCPQQ